MALPNTGITTSLVGTTLGTSNRNVGGLCTNSNINPWSRWKPIHSDKTTLTLDEIKYRGFGIEILKANNAEGLVNQIKANNNLGYRYIPPRGGENSPFRLGDFRNYDHNARMPLYPTFYDGDTMNLGGVTSSNHGSYEKILIGLEVDTPDQGVDNLTHLTKGELYSYIDRVTGEPIKLRRGIYITNGVNNIWYSDKLFGWTTQVQQFKGSEVQVYEFLTNVERTPTVLNPANATDMFFALPTPLATIKFEDKVPAGSKKVGVQLAVKQDINNTRLYHYSVYLHAIGDEYRGGEVKMFSLQMTKDMQGMNMISRVKFEDRLDVPKGTKSKVYEGTMLNHTEGMTDGTYTPWFCLFFDYEIQVRTQALMAGPGPIQQ